MAVLTEAPGRPATAPGTQPVGMGLAAAVVVLSVASTWLALGPGARSWHGLLEDNVLNNSINGVVLGTVAGILLALRPRNRIGWLILFAAAVNALTVLGTGWTLTTFHHDLPGREIAAWVGSWVWVTALPLGGTVLFAIYPTGRAESKVARWIVRIGWAGSLVAAAAVAMLDDAYRSVAPGHPLGHNPVSGGLDQPLFTGVATAAALVEVALVLFTIGWTLRRLRRAESPEREQLSWLVLSVAPLLLGVLLSSPPVLFLLTVATSATLVIGIVRHQLFDIKLVLRSGLLYGGLTALAVGAYFAMVALITVFAASGAVPNLFAAATVGLVLVPVHRWSQSALTRLVYGDRSDPVRALTRVTESLRDTGHDESGLEPMLSGISRALRSPAVSVRDADGRVLGAVGTVRPDTAYEVVLEYAGEQVGVLAVAARTEGERFGRRDRDLVAVLAGPVAAAVRARLLAAELAESRARVLAVREGERRRLREDLHDGLGPSLSGVSLGLEAARRAVTTQPARVPEILEVVHREVDGLVAEVRGIIDDLGPGEVDLVAAVRGQTEAVLATGDVEVELIHAGDFDDVPGEVAVAAQRIAGEALTNAVRHAAATTVRVSLECRPGRLLVEVADDGTGDLRPRPGGVGLHSMRQRAEGIGGTLSIVGRPGAGTRVSADLPWERAR